MISFRKCKNCRLVVLLVLLTLRCVAFGSPVVISISTQINVSNTSLDGSDLIVSNCTLTINGNHPFNSLQLTNGGVLTHSAGVSNSFLVVSGNMTIDGASRVDVSGKGFASSTGPGAGAAVYSSGAYYGAGGGYGDEGAIVLPAERREGSLTDH